MTIINIPANTMRTFCWRQVIRLSLSLTRKVTWPYLCPFKIDRKANGAPFAFSEWLCSLFFAYISFKLLYCFFGINSTIKIVVVVVVVVLQHINLLRSTLEVHIALLSVAVSTRTASLVYRVTPVWTGLGDCMKVTSK